VMSPEPRSRSTRSADLPLYFLAGPHRWHVLPFFCTIQGPASGSHPIVPSGLLQDLQSFVWRGGIRPMANFRALQQFLSKASAVI
jgi:hypothetical protein